MADSGSEEKALTVTVVGFGSLLSPRSARTTFPQLSNFRVGRVDGWKRVFAHVGVIFIEKGLVENDSKEIASVAAEQAPGHSLLVSVFEIPAADYPAFQKREDFFKLTEVPVHAVDGSGETTRGIICGAFATDDEMIATNFPGLTKAGFYARFAQWYTGDVFRTDILPCRVYLKHCLTAAERLGRHVLDSFLDETFLGDGTTSLRAYLTKHPTLLDDVQLGKFDRYQG